MFGYIAKKKQRTDEVFKVLFFIYHYFLFTEIFSLISKKTLLYLFKLKLYVFTVCEKRNESNGNTAITTPYKAELRVEDAFLG